MTSATRTTGPTIWVFLACLGALSIGFAGCGNSKPMGKVYGNVTLNGEPYADAAVVFLCLDSGQAGSADIQADGMFQIATPLPVGTYQVYLAPKAETASDAPVPVSIDKSVPAKYWNESSTDIQIDVVDGDNEVTVPLVR